MTEQLEKRDKKCLGVVLGKIAAWVAVISVIVLFVLAILASIFDISEGSTAWQEMISRWPRILFFLIVATPLAIFGGIYGGKLATTNPRKSGWIMLIIGILSLFIGQPFAGLILLFTGIYTIFFQKPSSEVQK